MDNIYEVDEQVEFKAIITDCRYYNDDTTWGVYQFATDEDIPYFITSNDNKNNYGDCNYNKFSTLAGKMQELVIGGEYQIKATHKYDKKYGHQYVPISVFALIPQTKETQLLFLKSIIPESIAENLINAYLNKYRSRGLNEEDCAKFAKEDTRKEVSDAVQTFNYQCNSMTTTNGQSPFLSVFMYLGETSEYKAELALLIEEFLLQRIKGLKNEVGVYITQAFPKLLYVLEEDNINKDSKYWYLTELAAKCTAKRMVPDYISEKKMLEYKIDKNGEGHCYGCMGCRSFLTPYVNKQGKKTKRRCFFS